MDKAQAINQFWKSFGLLAYDENTVPSNASMPYITYRVSTDSLGTVLQMDASLWYYAEGWEEISKKADEIAEYITNIYPPAIPIDGGRMYITKGSPFAQRMGDSNPFVRRIFLITNVEFFTES